MNCYRCHGLMVQDVTEFTSVPTVLRCVNCGEMFDELILNNRVKQLAKKNRKETKVICEDCLKSYYGKCILHKYYDDSMEANAERHMDKWSTRCEEESDDIGSAG